LYGPRDLEDARGIIALRLLGVGLADIAAPSRSKPPQLVPSHAA
jgi:hypothetical protein